MQTDLVRSGLECKKKGAINLSVDCPFFSAIAENLFRDGSTKMFIAISLRRHRSGLAKQRREVALIL
ncbi:MAG TPA: hypothetical protein VHR27_03580, partial [Blastocatellia bacterium]|nr:hypothetical protein [Blastocatellia bacterium]